MSWGSGDDQPAFPAASAEKTAVHRDELLKPGSTFTERHARPKNSEGWVSPMQSTH